MPQEPDPKRPPWLLCEYLDLDHPRGVTVLRHEYLARVSPDRKHWDAIREYDYAPENAQDWLRITKQENTAQDSDPRSVFLHLFWEEYVASADRAHLKVARIVPFDRILALDPIGDRHYPVPHLFVEFTPEDGPFGSERLGWLEGIHGPYSFHEVPRPREDAREQFFPTPIPSKLFPPPDGLSYPLAKASIDLDATLKEGLKDVLEQAKPKPADASVKVVEHDGYRQKWLLHVERFCGWRDEVAIPVFTTFVRTLEEAGHQARIAVRTAKIEAGEMNVIESVELRVRMRCSTPWVPIYHREGHLTYFTNLNLVNGHVTIEQAPKLKEPERPERRYQPETPQEPPTFDQLAAKRIQADVVALLKRLVADE